MRTICTIITSDYFPYAATLYKSLAKINSQELLHVLVVDEGEVEFHIATYPGIKITRIRNVYNVYKADILYNKYHTTHPDGLRWSFKPVFITYLLEQGFEKVIFVDCDIFFFNDYHFLFTELDSACFLLTPAHTTRHYLLHEEEFLTAFKYGMYNAGFIGATKKAIAILAWWSDCCSYKIETNFTDGLFVDQKYLDAVPVLFENTRIIKHPGCNVAFWNQHECKRKIVNGKVLINGKHPIIFIHFTNKFIPELLNGNDELLFSSFQEYKQCFEETGFQLKQFIVDLPEYKKPNMLSMVKKKLLVRTRFKRWLLKLSQQL